MITLKSLLIFTLVWLFLAGIYKVLFASIQAPIHKRWFILLSPLVALFSATISLDFGGATNQVAFVVLPAITVTELSQPVSPVYEYTAWLPALFSLASVYFLFRLLQAVYNVSMLKKRSAVKRVDDTEVLVHESVTGPFTFFRWIFIPNQEMDAAVIKHENLHGQLKHSWDVVYWEILKVVLWWHPALWILKEEMDLNHEHQVDMQLETDSEEYKKILLKNAVSQWALPLSQPLSKNNQIKTRIAMMKRKVNNSKNRVFTGASVLLTILVAGFLQVACSDAKEELDSMPATKEEKTYTIVDEMPEFPGGTKAMFAYMGENLKYPKSVAEDGLEGVVFVSFVVDENGKIGDVEVLKGFASEADEAAKDLVAAMPDWTPGKKEGKKVAVKYNLPIRFTLE